MNALIFARVGVIDTETPKFLESVQIARSMWFSLATSNCSWRRSWPQNPVNSVRHRFHLLSSVRSTPGYNPGLYLGYPGNHTSYRRLQTLFPDQMGRVRTSDFELRTVLNSHRGRLQDARASFSTKFRVCNKEKH